MKKIFTALFLLCTLVVSAYVLADNYKAGTSAGGSITTGDDNYISGDLAGMHLTTGYGNTLLGQFAGYQLTTGTGNVLLGYMSGYKLTTSTHKLYINNGFYPSYGIFGDFSTGYFGINNTSPAASLDITGTFKLSGAFTPASNIIAMGDTNVFTNETIVSNATEADTATVKIFYNSTNNPTVAFYDSNGATGSLIFSSDTFNIIGGKFVAVGDTVVFSKEVLVVNPTEADTSTIKFPFPTTYASIDFFDSEGLKTTIANTSYIMYFQGALNGYNFDNNINGPQINLGSGVTGGTISTVDTNENLTIDPNGTGLVKINGLASTVQTIISDSTLTAGMSGNTICNTGATAGDSLFLPTCASGLTFKFISTDADSMIIQCASGDSIFSTTTTKPSFEGHAVNQSITIIGMPTLGSQFNWIVDGTPLGTWTGN